MDSSRSTDSKGAGGVSRSTWSGAFRTIDALAARHEKWLLAALVLWPIVRSVDLLLQPFNFDETLTLAISSLPGIDAVLKAAPADGNPPLYYLLTGVSLRLLGPTEFATRLPSVLAFVVTSLCLYSFVRRRCPPIAALFALFSFDLSTAATYAFAGRPYMLLLAFTTVAMVSWQRASEGRSKRALALAGVVFGVAGAIASHHFGALHVGVPLAVGEAWRLAERRRFDIPLYLSGLAGASMLTLTVPLMAQTNVAFLAQVKESATFYGTPHLDGISSYFDMVDGWLLAAFVVSAVIAGWFFPEPSSKPADRAIPGHEVAAASGLAALVPIMLAVTWIATGYFAPRYAIGSSVGIAMLLGFAASGRLRPLRIGTAAVPLCLSLLVVVFAAQEARVQVAKWRGRFIGPVVPYWQTAAVLDAAPADKPIVIASAGMYPVLWWYSPPERRLRMHYLSDLSFAVRQKDPLAELTLVGDRPFVPFKVEDYGAFLAGHREFYLHCMIVADSDCNDATTWIRDRLISEGHAVTPVARTARGLLLHVVLK